jgi:plasmid stability protein
MPELRINAPDELVEQLRLRAKATGRSLEEIVLEDLRRATAGDAATAASPGPDGDKQASALAGLAEAKLGPVLARLVRDVSAERRRELAEKASVGKPLSRIIIEDRGE